MDTTTSPRRRDAVVIGAGLAGLATARLLCERGLDVVVLDGQAPGGRAATDERDGFLLNRGPHALYRHGPAERVLSRLRVPLPGHPPSTDAWGLRGELQARLPADPVSLLRTPLVGWRGKLGLARLLRRLPRVRAESLAGLSFRAWLDDQGLPADATQLVEMLARTATYSHAPELSGADLVIGQVQQALASGVRYLDGGWGALARSLASGLEIRPQAVARVSRDGKDVEVHGVDGSLVVARAAVVATGTPRAAAAVLGRAPYDVGPPVEAACLDLGTTGPAARGLLLGVDVPLYLSDHGVAAALAPRPRSVVHVVRYLAPGEDLGPEAARHELEAHAARAGLGPDRIVTARYLHRMVVAGSSAPAAHGGLAGRPPVATEIEGVFLAGDWVGPTGHLLDAALASAEHAAEGAARSAMLVAQ